MCTALTFRSGDHYFGRTLDVEESYGEAVTVTPRNCPLSAGGLICPEGHFAMIGIAHIRQGIPLYYDCVNEKGLAIAALLFPGCAHYRPAGSGGTEVPSYFLIPWLLGQCATLEEARQRLDGVVITDAAFDQELPPTPLHWLLADGEGAVVIEQGRHGLQVLDASIGVLTNAPEFETQMLNLSAHMALSPHPPVNRLARGLALPHFSRGMGAMGMPGDLSSPSRFVRAAFARWNAEGGKNEEETVEQFFHILDSVQQTRGCVILEDGRPEFTRYTSCCNTCKGIYYYTTYGNRRITAVDLNRENLDGRVPISYPLIDRSQFLLQNG